MSSSTWVPPEEEPRDTYGHDGSWEVITTCDPLESDRLELEPDPEPEPELHAELGPEPEPEPELESGPEPDEPEPYGQSRMEEDEPMEETFSSMIQMDDFNTSTFSNGPFSHNRNPSSSYTYSNPPIEAHHTGFSTLRSQPGSAFADLETLTFPSPPDVQSAGLSPADTLFQEPVVNTNPACHPDLVEISFGNLVVEYLPPKPPSVPPPRSLNNLRQNKVPDYLTDNEVDMNPAPQPYCPPTPPPAPPPAPEYTPPPNQWGQLPSFASLSAKAKAGKLVFRVYSPTSSSPLQWTGSSGTSGFGSNNYHLGALTPTGYMYFLEERQREEQGNLPRNGGGNGKGRMNGSGAASGTNAIAVKGNRYGGQTSGGQTSSGPREPWANWLSGPVMRQNIVDHILRKPRLTAVDPGEGQHIPTDALSPFISASADLEWVIWDVARRIALGEEDIQVAIILIEPPKGRTRDTSGASGEIVVDPLPPLTAHRRTGRGSGERGRMTHSEKENVDTAIASATASAEVLFYGRIFADSIVASLGFEWKGTPFDLPKYMVRDGDGSWMERLVWRTGDNYTTAEQKMDEAKGRSLSKSSRSRTPRKRW